MKENRAVLMLLMASVLISSSGVLIKFIDWSPFVLFGARSVLAAASMFVLGGGRKGLRLTKRNILFGLIVFVCGLVFILATKMTTSANAVVFKNSAPVFVMVLSMLFLRTRYRKRDYVAVAVALFGIALFFLDKLDMTQLLGNIFALTCGILFASQFVLFANNSPADSHTSLLFGQIFGAAAMIPFFFIDPPTLTVSSVGAIVVLAVLALAVSNVLWTVGIRYCPPLKASLINMVEPILNPILVLLFWGEQPGRFALIGGVIVIATITLWSVADARHAVPKGTADAVIAASDVSYEKESSDA